MFLYKSTKIYSDERKHLVLKAHANNSNLSIRTLAQLFSVSKTTVHRWICENKKEPQEFSVQNKERKLDKILALIDYEYGNANSIAFKKEIQSGA